MTMDNWPADELERAIHYWEGLSTDAKTPYPVRKRVKDYIVQAENVLWNRARARKVEPFMEGR